MTLRALALVAVGGGLGAVARYLLATAVDVRLLAGFSLGTLAVNTLGSFAIGALAGAPALSAEARLFWATGVLGGFTTWSAFNDQVLRLAAGGRPGAAAGYAAATVGCGLVAGVLGMAAGRLWA